MTRPLSASERGILDLLLSVDFPGVQALREQAVSVRAARLGIIVDLVVDPALPLAEVVNRTPVEAPVQGDGGVLLFVDHGRLSALEYWWVTEQRPASFPSVSEVGKSVAQL